MVLPWFYPGFANKNEDVISKLEFITSVTGIYGGDESIVVIM